jgi:hypothetical protein
LTWKIGQGTPIVFRELAAVYFGLGDCNPPPNLIPVRVFLFVGLDKPLNRFAHERAGVLVLPKPNLPVNDLLQLRRQADVHGVVSIGPAKRLYPTVHTRSL